MLKPSELVPGIVAVPDSRMVFKVRSKSGNEPSLVDAEARQGLMRCSCPRWQHSKSPDKYCHHVGAVRALIACSLIQSKMCAEDD